MYITKLSSRRVLFQNNIYFIIIPKQQTGIPSCFLSSHPGFTSTTAVEEIDSFYHLRLINKSVAVLSSIGMCTIRACRKSRHCGSFVNIVKSQKVTWPIAVVKREQNRPALGRIGYNEGCGWIHYGNVVKFPIR